MLIIRSITVLDDYWVRLGLDDGLSVERNLRDLMRGPVFESLLADYSRFRTARVRHGTVVWPTDIDLDPVVLMWDGPAPPNPTARPPARLELHHPRG